MTPISKKIKAYVRRTQPDSAVHLAGIIPVAAQPLEYSFPWHDALIPVANNLLAVEWAVLECLAVGCQTIWIVCPNDMQPLIRFRLGEWLSDLRTATKMQHSTMEIIAGKKEHRTPIFYISLKASDRRRRLCAGMSIIHGMRMATSTPGRLSHWLEPHKFYIAFPHGIYSLDILVRFQKEIQGSCNRTCLEYNHQTCLHDRPYGFTLFPEDIKPLASFFKLSDSPHARYSREQDTLSNILQKLSFKNDTVIELPWAYDIRTWEGYRQYLGSEHASLIVRPDPAYLSYHEFGIVGVPPEYWRSYQQTQKKELEQQA
jgi:hypothetical protein